MATRPDKLPEWASVTDSNPNPTTGQYNVVEPPTDKKLQGWDYLEFPVRNWMNWLHRKNYEWLKYFDDREKVVVTDGNGENLFPIANSVIVMLVMDKVDPVSSPPLFLVGWRGDNSSTPQLTALNASDVISLATSESASSQPITGVAAENVAIVGISFPVSA